MMLLKFTRHQLTIFILASCTNFFSSLCASLQAPFYPAEAEKKGATATEYGLVFGIFEFVCFVASPFFGKMVERIKPKILLTAGALVNSVSVICFGFIDFIDDRVTFVILSFVFRITASLGTSAAVVSAFSISIYTFQNDVGMMMSTLEMFSGLGFIIGPTTGGLLFHVGGFLFPFLCIGTLSLIVVTLTWILIPDAIEKQDEKKSKGKILSLLRNPAIAMDSISSIVASLSQGFVFVTLEPNLRQFNVSQVAVDFIFIIIAITYAVTSPIFGKIADKYVNPKYFIVISRILSIISYLIIGPLPILPIPKTLILWTIALFIQGLALSMGAVSSFVDSVKSAVKAGYPEDMTTFGLMSGMWISCFSCGAFIGPSVGGFLYDYVGFQNSTLFVIFVDSILFLYTGCRVAVTTPEDITYGLPSSFRMGPVFIIIQDNVFHSNQDGYRDSSTRPEDPSENTRFIDFIDDRVTFVILPFVFRITASLGTSAAVVSAFSISICTFQNDVGMMMSTLEMFSGLGFIIGPTTGGLLFHVGGFLFPFLCIGTLSLIVVTLTWILIPDAIEKQDEKKSKGKMFSLLRNPAIAMDSVVCVVSAISQGFVLVTLEPNLRQVRPLPILPIPKTLILWTIALFIQGLALSMGAVSSFVDSVKSAVKAGYPEDMTTFGLMSGMWISCFSCGAFIGPSVGGFLYDYVGFQNSTLFVIFVDSILVLNIHANNVRVFSQKKYEDNKKNRFTSSIIKNEMEIP
ncbi:hypothetical protein PGB90_007567 [Kerria lacca]